MMVKYRGFNIEVLPEADQYIVKCKRLDGSMIDHEDNPDYCDTEEDAKEQGESIIDDFLDGV